MAIFNSYVSLPEGKILKIIKPYVFLAALEGTNKIMCFPGPDIQNSSPAPIRCGTSSSSRPKSDGRLGGLFRRLG